MYQFTYEPTPKNVLLDLMGVNKRHELSTSQLGFISDAFNISINNLRVTLNRLACAKLITHDGRGLYHLTKKALAKRAFIDRWQQNSFHYNNWNHSWLTCHLPKGVTRTIRKKSLLVLEWYGFAPGLDHLWVRPNNLKHSQTEIITALAALGLEENAHCFVIQEAPASLVSQWNGQLWDIDRLDSEYDALIQSLEDSLRSLASKPINATLCETCRLGGEAIHRLAIDPLLPKVIRPKEKYQLLKNIVRKYDRAGRNIWLEQLKKLGID
ncbi:hypothetical protein BTJ40_09965 [Microbulbifer sp. A4B17]|uniref:hypothetical protein n=1 Tax=Microbulbifer sp. A4B17 TaxID=359370 RepID=UPI000D52BB08|nr:hypothetical protein [Microbulbifer sp. A4B17]AWF81115.1 hypothetical protein BTJ40_09965 [Microbulbifer sp. A4B17]